MQQQDRYIGIISIIPIYALSAFLSQFVPQMVAVTLFIVCFIIFIAVRKQYDKWKIAYFLNYFLLVFCSIHFFAFCLDQIPDGTSYDSPSDENAAKSIVVVFSLPFSFIFAVVAGVLFDKWKIKSLNRTKR